MCDNNPVCASRPFHDPSSGFTFYCLQITNNSSKAGVVGVLGASSTWNPIKDAPSIAVGDSYCSLNAIIGEHFAILSSTSPYEPVSDVVTFTTPGPIILGEKKVNWKTLFYVLGGVALAAFIAFLIYRKITKQT